MYLCLYHATWDDPEPDRRTSGHKLVHDRSPCRPLSNHAGFAKTRLPSGRSALAKEMPHDTGLPFSAPTIGNCTYATGPCWKGTAQLRGRAPFRPVQIIMPNLVPPVEVNKCAQAAAYRNRILKGHGATGFTPLMTTLH